MSGEFVFVGWTGRTHINLVAPLTFPFATTTNNNAAARIFGSINFTVSHVYVSNVVVSVCFQLAARFII